MIAPPITPGKWRDCLHTDMTPPQVKVEAGNVVVCDTIGNEANARAISAVPELLAELCLIHANAGESVEWIRRHTTAALTRAGYTFPTPP